MDSLPEKFLCVTADILKKQLGVADEPQILIFDRQSPLSNLLANAYVQNMPKAEIINFDEWDPQEITQKLLVLPAGATVILVQSRDFRLDDFRIRLKLFNNGVGCLEHTHLQYFYPEQYETYADALVFRGEYYKNLGIRLAEKIENSLETKIFSRDGSVLSFGKMEKCQVNHGLFSEQKNRGGGAICGEVFSEALDFSTVNGEMMVSCYPDKDLRIVVCKPFRVRIEKSMLHCDDPLCPQDFRENILERITREEEGEVMVREAGFGLNPAISIKTPLADVNAFERMAGFHLSLGKKHNIYRQKIHKKIVQRYHIDIFADLERIEVDRVCVFEKGRYLLV
ncbi:MAG: hypothetical protein WCJ84_01720 [Candidatus Peregrinibacteria bacterium]